MIGLLSPPAAQAACPGIFNGKSCDGGHGGNNCALSGSAITCDLRQADTAAAVAKFVSPGNTRENFRAYGYDGDGDAFCCEYTPGVNCTIVIQGTSLADTLDNFDAAPTPVLDLYCNSITVEGRDGDDTLHGSAATSVVENLLGGEDDDVIHGGDGADYIDGDAGDDTLYGESGADEMYGGTGDDTLYGGDNDDALYGEEDADLVCGEWGEDTHSGGSGDDFVFGGVGDDVSNDGDAGTNYCENDATTSGCTYLSLTSCTRSP